MAQSDAAVALKHTPLYAMHVRLGARMVPFAGYDMPVQYPGGIIREHLHTRAAAGLFDVSHMGQIALHPRSGQVEDAARALEALVPGDMIGLAPGRQRYTLFTNTAGGVLDDLMVSNLRDHLVLVVNAACKEADEAHLRAHLSSACDIERLADRALVALQGPLAEAALARFAPQVRALRFMDARMIVTMDEPCLVSRSGYTGEDGFEISIRAARVEALCEALLRDSSVEMAGLGARDTLRLEAGLCLYGADLTPEITPVEAALEWAISPVRRTGGARAGGVPGADVIMRQLAEGAARRRVGLRPEGRALVRAGAPLFRSEDAAAPMGAVTSGGFGISLDAPVAMGYVPIDAAAPGTQVFAEVRGKRLPVVVAELPFVAPHYKRQ
jgi:glycine cleavage system T protein (aminomethyltransferase)